MVLLLGLVLLLGVSQGIVNNKVTRSIELDGNNVKSSTFIDIFNDGKENGQDIETYLLALN